MLRPPWAGRTLEDMVLRGTVVLFFFNALFDRLALHYLGLSLFTNTFYGLLGLGIVLRIFGICTSGRIPRLGGLAALFLGFALLLGLAYGNPEASAFGIKQFFIGAVFLFVFSGRQVPVNTVLWSLLLMQLYAVYQGVHFLTQGLTLPPWDMAYVESQIETWAARNLFQDQLVRPFATFASFSEYQIVAHMTTVVLWLARNELSVAQGRVTWLALAILIGIDALLPDRTPILMAAITVITALLGSHLIRGARTSPRRLAVGLALVVAVVASFQILPALFMDATNPGLRRLAEAFRVWEAETVRERAGTAWAQSVGAIRANPEGLGPLAVATSINGEAIVPHNNYFLWAIGYSVVFPPTFLAFIALAFWQVYRSVASPSEARSRLGYTGLGLTLAYLASSFFNATFASYPGAMYFLLMLWLDDHSRAPRHELPPAANNHSADSGIGR